MKDPAERSLILGIDPGLTGALVLLDPNGPNGPRVFGSYRMPTMVIPSRSHDKRSGTRVDFNALGDLVGRIHKWIRYAVIEEVGSRPNQSSQSTFNFGDGYGIVKGVMGAFMIPLHFVRPDVWKLLIGVTSDKKTSFRKATEIFGEYTKRNHWPRKSDDGIVEAALIAHFGLRFLQGKPLLKPNTTKADFERELLG